MYLLSQKSAINYEYMYKIIKITQRLCILILSKAYQQFIGEQEKNMIMKKPRGIVELVP